MYTDTVPSVRTMATAFAAATIYTGLLFAVAASPANAATTDAGFVRNVESQIRDQRWAPSAETGVATVAVRIDATGSVTSAAVAGSSGHALLDRDALQTAKSLSYPGTGRSRTVAVVMRYGADAKAPPAAKSAALVNRYVNSKGEALAAETPAPNVG